MRPSLAAPASRCVLAVLAFLVLGAVAARAEAPLLVSVAANGSGGGVTLSGIATPTNPLGSVASVTPDGRYVAFCSDLGLLPGTSMAKQVYVRDIVTSTTTLVSVNATGTGGAPERASTGP